MPPPHWDRLCTFIPIGAGIAQGAPRSKASPCGGVTRIAPLSISVCVRTVLFVRCETMIHKRSRGQERMICLVRVYVGARGGERDALRRGGVCGYQIGSRERGKDMILTCTVDRRIVCSGLSRGLHGPRRPAVVLRDMALSIVVARRAGTMMSSFEDATLYPLSIVCFQPHIRVLLLQS